MNENEQKDKINNEMPKRFQGQNVTIVWNNILRNCGQIILSILINSN